MDTLDAEDRHPRMAELRGIRGDSFCRPVCTSLGHIDFVGEGYRWFSILRSCSPALLSLGRSYKYGRAAHKRDGKRKTAVAVVRTLSANDLSLVRRGNG